MIARLFSLAAVFRGKSDLAATQAEETEDAAETLQLLVKAETWNAASGQVLDLVAEIIEDRERQTIVNKWED